MAIFSLKSKEVLSNLTAPANIDLGAMIPIATTVVGSGGSTAIAFNSIPQNYEHLQIRIFWRPTVSSNAAVRFNGDNTGANYADHRMYGNGSGVIAAGYTSVGGCFWGYADAGTNAAYIVDILDYANTNKNKVTRSIGGQDNNGSGYAWMESAVWLSTSAITSLELGGSFAQYTHAALYGIKRAGA